MTMQIREIILYHSSGQTRRLPFRIGEVNIISGASQTGKTALIGIVEYCLGLDPCPVPKGVIRDNVAWYGLLLQFPDTQCFIARRDPGPLKSTSSEIYLEVGDDLQPPPLEGLRQTTTKDSLVDFLTRKVGITANVHEPPDHASRRPLEANIKHALFLVFQRQDEVAKPTLLFHRQDEEFIPQSIRDTLPYFLGAVGEDRLAPRQELRRLRVELKRLEREALEAAALQKGVLPRATGLLTEAYGVGLVAPLRSDDSNDVQGMLEKLEAVLERDVEGLAEGRSITEDLNHLREQRGELLAQHRRVRDRLDSARGLLREQGGYSHEIQEQHARLQSVNLLARPYADVHNCPLCESTLAEPLPGTAALQDSLEQLSSQLERVEDAPPRLAAYIERAQDEALSIQNQLRENQQMINSLVAQDQALLDRRALDERRAYVKGRISVYLETAGSLPTGEEGLTRELEDVNRRVAALERELRDDNLKDVVGSILNLLSREMSSWGVQLGLEYAKYPLRIDIAQLTVVADTSRGPVRMDEMGSAQNWLACHITAFLALHRYFAREDRPVPRFIFFDQPSQVYYPPERDIDGRLDVLKDEDSTAVRALYSLIFRLIGEIEPKLQVIITDHADLGTDEFQEALVERWRDGNKLVPAHWISSQTKPA